jgi:hypothetical protein
VNPFDDDVSMRARSDEELLRGTAVNADPALTALVAMLRDSAEVPGPRPTDALATLLSTGRAPGALAAGAPIPVAASNTVPLGTRLRRLTSRAAALGLAAKIALTAGVAVASVGTVAAIDGVPADVQERAAATLDRIVEVFVPGSPADPDQGSPATPGQSPGDDAVVPGASGAASHRPTQHASPTDLPTSDESGKELPEPATSNRADRADRVGSSGSEDAAAPGPSSAAAQDAHATDQATDPNRDASDSSTGRSDPASTAAATPTPSAAPSAEPTHAADRD